MGIMLILGFGLIVGIVLIFIGKKKHNTYDISGWTLFGIFGILILLCSLNIIASQTTADSECQKLQERKNAIEYLLEQIDTNDLNIMINGGIYDDIVEYNNDVREYKIFRNSFWTNWFVSKGLDEFDYIEYDIDKSQTKCYNKIEYLRKERG